MGEWHGVAVQDARPLASTGFRPPFGLGRVTFLCVAKEKSPKERPSLMALLTLPLPLGGLEGEPRPCPP